MRTFQQYYECKSEEHCSGHMASVSLDQEYMELTFDNGKGTKFTMDTCEVIAFTKMISLMLYRVNFSYALEWIFVEANKEIKKVKKLKKAREEKMKKAYDEIPW